MRVVCGSFAGHLRVVRGVVYAARAGFRRVVCGSFAGHPRYCRCCLPALPRNAPADRSRVTERDLFMIIRIDLRAPSGRKSCRFGDPRGCSTRLVVGRRGLTAAQSRIDAVGRAGRWAGRKRMNRGSFFCFALCEATTSWHNARVEFVGVPVTSTALTKDRA